PHPVSANYVGLAVVGNLLDLTLAEVALHLTAIEAFRLPRQAHNPADLMKGGLSLRTERGEDVTQIDRILGVPVEVGPRRKPRRGYTVDHGSVAQYGQVEAIAVKRDELRLQLRNLIAEGGDKLLLCSLAHVGCADGVHRPMIGLAVCDEGSDANDRVVDMLREFISDRLAYFHVGLADKIVGGCELAEVGHSLQVPDDDAWFHADRRLPLEVLRGDVCRLRLLNL